VPHQAVLFTAALQQLNLKPDGIYVDGTFGRGGHSAGILNALSDKGRLIAFDRDMSAISSPVALALRDDARFQLIHACFSHLEHELAQRDLIGQIDGILLDLGVSSPQLDTPERGFSFMRDGLLDMRMDNTSGLSAAQWLATVSEQDLVQVLFDYGEERFARRIARAVITQRVETPITTTRQLVDLINVAVPVKEKHKHPATRTFQALRIVINDELGELQRVLQQSVALLKPQGRLVVIAFHSLEDRIVKRFIRAESGAKHAMGKLPIKEVDIIKGELIKIGKTIRADAQEIAVNPRARSAILRVAEKI
jgi:16S rRNA (cytosine1402-N4)-methyltransferase